MLGSEFITKAGMTCCKALTIGVGHIIKNGAFPSSIISMVSLFVFDIARNTVGLFHHVQIIMFEYIDSPSTLEWSSRVICYGGHGLLFQVQLNPLVSSRLTNSMVGGFDTSRLRGICLSWIVVLILLVKALFTIPSAMECFVIDFCYRRIVCYPPVPWKKWFLVGF